MTVVHRSLETVQCSLSYSLLELSVAIEHGVPDCCPEALFFLFLGLKSLLNNRSMVLAFCFFLDGLLEVFPPVLEGRLLVISLTAETSDHVGLRHQFLHLVGEILFARILYTVESFDDLLSDLSGTM